MIKAGTTLNRCRAVAASNDDRNRYRARLRRGMGLLVFALGFIYLFSARIGWDDFVATLSAFEWRLAPQILIAQIGFIALGGLALWLLITGQRAVGLGAILAAYWRCVAVGYWTPAATGELSLAWFLRPYGLSLHDGLALITVDKLVTVLALGILAVPTLGWIFGPLIDSVLQPRTVIFLFALAALGAVVFVASRIGRLRSFTLRLLANGRAYLFSLRSLALSSPARLAGNLGLTFLRATIGNAVLWWSITAFEPAHTVTFAQLLVFSSAARLLALALPAPNGLGVYEVALVELLSPGKVAAASVLSGVLFSRVIALLAIALGLALWSRYPVFAEAPSRPACKTASESPHGPR
jgi:uncharacterized membrane protein YbhN (UPF0104 family)